MRAEQRSTRGIALLTVVLLVYLATTGHTLLSSWEANVGFVSLSRAVNSREHGVTNATIDRLLGSVSHFHRALAWDQENQVAKLGLGISEEMSGNYERAVVELKDLVQLAPDYLWAWFYLGKAYVSSGDYERAQEAFLRFGDWRYPYQEGLRAKELGDLDMALAWFEVAVAIKPNSQILDQVLPLYLTQGRKDDAIKACERLAQEEPIASSEYWWAVGKMASLQGNWQAAVVAYAQGAEMASDPHLFYELMGGALEMQGDFQGALDAYKHSVQVKPDSFYAYVYAGRAAAALGDVEQARNWYLRALAVDPMTELPHLYLGILDLTLDNYDDARKHLNQAKEKNPKNALVYWYLSQLAYRAGDLDAAVNYLEKAVTLASNPYWWIQMGDWQIQRGNTQAAISAFEQALRLAPGLEHAIAQLSKLKHR